MVILKSSLKQGSPPAGRKRPGVIYKSIGRALADFNGLRFNRTEIFTTEWTTFNAEDNFGSVSLSKDLPQEAKGLIFGSEEAYFFGIKLRHLRYNTVSSSILFGSPTEDGPVGFLKFTANRSGYIGAISPSPKSPPSPVRGLNTNEMFHTRIRRSAENEWTPWKTLQLGTKWVEENGQDILVLVVHLGTEDISDRCSVTNSYPDWSYDFEMVPGLNPLIPDPSSFSIRITPHLTEPYSTFSGTYHVAQDISLLWEGESFTPEHGCQSNAEVIALLDQMSNPTDCQSQRASTADPTLSLSDLLNVSSLQESGYTEDGEIIYDDAAQLRTGQYFQNILIGCIQGGDSNGSWVEQLFGGAPELTEGCRDIRDSQRLWFETQATPNAGQILSDCFAVSEYEQIEEAVATIDTDRISSNYESMSESPEFAEVSSSLYLEGYRDAVVGIRPYLEDDSTNWGQAFYDLVTSGRFLNGWAARMSSNNFDNVKQEMYDIYVKLLLLCPEDSELPESALSIMYSTFLNTVYSNALWVDDMLPYLVQALDELLDGNYEFGDEVLDLNEEEIQEAIAAMVSAKGTRQEFILSLSQFFVGIGADKPLLKMMKDFRLEGYINDEYNEVAENPKQKSKMKKGIQCLAYAGIAGMVLGSIFSEEDINIAVATGMVLMSTGLVVKGAASVVSLSINRSLGNWMKVNVSVSGGGWKKKTAGFLNWFTDNGAVPDSWAVKVFGQNYADFLGKRLGPALAVVGVAFSAVDLVKAVKSGDVGNIIFETINLLVAVTEVIIVGLELMSFAWAGPAGLAVAAVGAIVALIQWIYNIFAPREPPPSPIENYIHGPLSQAGYTKQ